MAEQPRNYLAFNRGVVSSRGLARIDVERIELSADRMRNYMPRVLGSMMIRPGLEYIDNSESNQFARNIDFVFGVNNTALLEVTSENLKVRIDDVVITRPSVSTVIDNGDFSSGISGWTDASETGGSVTSFSHYGWLSGDGTDFGILRQTIAVAGADQNVEHALRVVIQEGPVRFKVGSSAGEDDYVSETRLQRGTHSLSFTPTGSSFSVELANEREYDVWVDEVTVEAAGEMSLPTPWSANDLPYLRWDQSGDVVYVACLDGDADDGSAERLIRIERRGTGRSWSVVNYLPEDGPFRVQNTSGVTLTASALTGTITLTASQPVFRVEHATHNALFRIASNGQTVTKSISGADDFTDTIRVTGSESAREFGIIIEGTFSATVTLQFGFTEDGPWNDQGTTWTAPVSTTYDDGQDGQIIYYRIGVKTGDYTSGTVTCTLTYTGGSIQGIARVQGYASSTNVTAHVLKAFGSVDASRDWWEGEWSLRRGYPTALAINEGRLTLAGNDRFWASVSDDFESFDDNVQGDSAPISRSIGHGPIKTIHWILSMARLLMGTSDTSANVAARRLDGNNPLSIRSSNFDEPITRTNFTVKPASSRGAFVDRSGQRLYELSYDIDVQDYKSVDLSIYTPDYNSVGITQIAIQMKPDIRIHCVRSDGTVGVLVYDRLENVICWCDVDSSAASGVIEDVAVLPGTEEDQVYYIVKRTINGSVVRQICKWAKESEAIGGSMNKMADSFTTFDPGYLESKFTGLSHLEGETVSVWADGAEVDDVVVSSGQITLGTAAREVVVGLKYTAQWRSGKLGKVDGIGLLDEKRVNRIGFIAENLHHQGLQYGPSFDQLYDLPGTEDGSAVADDTIHSEYHQPDFAFGGEWEPDSRICLQSQSPRPCTLLALTSVIETLVDGEEIE